MKTEKIFPQILTLFILSIFILISSFTTAESATIRVPADQLTIQAGIDAASEGDTVLVADGTYTGERNKNLDFKGKAITVRSENGAETCIIDCENEGRGFYFHSGETAESVLSGFTVRNGKVNFFGGGIYCSTSSPTIMNCKISNNIVELGGYGYDPPGGGAGISCGSSSPKIMNCDIISNRVVVSGRRTSGYGGGILCSSSSPSILNCNIINNEATSMGSGGGIACSDSSSAVISGCTITGNSANGGGGISCGSSSPKIMNCSISDNKTTPVTSGLGPFTSSGGGISCTGSSPTIMNCNITRNNSSSRDWAMGAGIYCISESSPTITNCDISDNKTSTQGFSKGGGIYCSNSSPTIMNCTFRNNSTGISLSTGNGGGLFSESSSPPKIVNSIFWGNSPDEIVGDVNATYSDVEGGYSGIGNVNVDPKFMTNDVSQLSSSSPCIDRGTSNGAPSEDIDGTSRPQGDGYDMGAYEFFLAPSAPKATTGAATEITDSSATLSGTVNPNGGSSWYYFEYGTSTSYGYATGTQSCGAGTSQVSVSSNITGLDKNTTFHFRIVGANNAGTSYGSDQTFTTSPIAPAVTTGPATSVTCNSATLTGTVNPNGATTSYHFEYGATESYGSTTTETSIGSGTSDVSVSVEITGLDLVTTYYYRLVATNSEGTTNGSDQSFITNPLAPSVNIRAATAVDFDSATLNGIINPNGASTTYYFEYGTTTVYGLTTMTTSAGSGTSVVSVYAGITGLSKNTTYHFRLVAANSAGTSSGGDQIFVTSSAPGAPSVTTGSAAYLTSTSVILYGQVNPNGSDTGAYFEYGPTTDYGFVTQTEDIGSGSKSVSVNATVTALIPETAYHYRLVATNSGGTSFGADKLLYQDLLYVSSDGTCGGKRPCFSTIQPLFRKGFAETPINRGFRQRCTIL